MSIPNVNFSSSNYGNEDFKVIFPITKYYYVQINNNNSTASGTIIHNSNYGTNYAVFSSIYYGFTGSSGTYNASNTSSALDSMVIHTINDSSFSWVLRKTTGDNVNIYIVFMVVFNDMLNYPKVYS